jgi:phosphoglycolate phosphatase-like HAD superfamily hydrolase
MIELVVFDMAGTTIDAGDDVAEVFRATLARWSVPVTGEQIAAVRGASKRHIRIALNSGFDRSVAGAVLEAVGWTGIADALVCGDEVRRGRPAPFLIFQAMQRTGVASVHAVANVGDTALDLQAGFNAGVRMNVGVCSGAHPRARLAVEPHTHLIESVADIAMLLTSRAAAKQPSERR